jgi:hypothetical protein
MKKPTKPYFLLIMIIILGGGLLAACGQTGGGGGQPQVAATMEGYPALDSQAPAATYTPFPYPEPGAEEPPIVNEKLEASDPATVQLASGKPQLVEFFAFW